MQAAINLQGEQVEFHERKEKHDLRKEINSLLVTVGWVSKQQFLRNDSCMRIVSVLLFLRALNTT